MCTETGEHGPRTSGTGPGTRGAPGAVHAGTRCSGARPQTGPAVRARRRAGPRERSALPRRRGSPRRGRGRNGRRSPTAGSSLHRPCPANSTRTMGTTKSPRRAAESLTGIETPAIPPRFAAVRPRRRAGRTSGAPCGPASALDERPTPRPDPASRGPAPRRTGPAPPRPPRPTR